MTSAQILSIPIGSRNSLAGNAQKVIPVRMKFPLGASVLFLPDFVCVDIWGCMKLGAYSCHTSEAKGNPSRIKGKQPRRWEEVGVLKEKRSEISYRGNGTWGESRSWLKKAGLAEILSIKILGFIQRVWRN